MGIIKDFIMKSGKSSLVEACATVVQQYLDRDRNGQYGIEKFLRIRSIPVVFVDDAPFEGRLDRNSSGQHRITIKRCDRERRMRFTLAHEVGHWIIEQELGSRLDENYRGLFHNSVANDEEESLADSLGAEILMPLDMVDFLSKHRLSFAMIDECHRRFGVSRDASLRRFSSVTCRCAAKVLVIPSSFKNVKTTAIVDDAWFVEPERPLRRQREQVWLDPKCRFDLLNDHQDLHLVVSDARFVFNFEAVFRGGMMPRAFLCGELTEEVTNKN